MGRNRLLCFSPKGNDIAGAALQLTEARDMLGPEARSRLDNTFLQSTNIILQAAQRNEALAQLPIGILDVVPKRVWRKKKTHGLADAAGLASAEITHRDLGARKRLKGRKSQQL